MRRKTYCLLVVLFVLSFVGTALSEEFWGSKNSNKYHYPSCVWAQKIKPANLIKFNSAEEASKAGYVPCKVCKPPLALNDGDAKLAMNEEHRRGCCSWHGGVCGCENGRVVCCDGTLSPSCTCNE